MKHLFLLLSLSTSLGASMITSDVKASPSKVDLEQQANAGNPTAQYNLGSLHYEGESLSGPDYVQALHWFTKAAEKDYPMSQSNLGIMYSKGVRSEINYQLADKCLKEAA